MTYLNIEETFSTLLNKNKSYTFENLIQPVIDSMEKYNFSLVHTEPIVKKDAITYQCNDCHIIKTTTYSHLIKKGNCKTCKPHSGGGPKTIYISNHHDLPEKNREVIDQTSFLLVSPGKPTPVSGNFHFQCKNCEHVIGPVGLSHMKTCIQKYPEFNGCSNCKTIEASKSYKTTKCHHNVLRKFCKECNGSGLCEHDNIKYSCTKCTPKERCEHNLNKENCGKCGGKNLCIHKKQKYNCREC